MSDEPYHYWKFRGAVEGLAESELALRERLINAMQGMSPVRDQDLPAGILDTWLELRAHTTWNESGDPREGTWANTIRALSDDDAKKVAKLIVRLFEQTARGLSGEPL